MVVGGGQGLVGEVAGALAYPRLAKKYFSDAVSSYVPYFFLLNIRLIIHLKRII